MFNRILSALFVLTLCFSCQQSPTPNSNSVDLPSEEESIKPPEISINESKGLKSVITHYGGQGHFATGTLPATAEKEKTDIFEIELSDSKLANKQKQTIGFTASNMAYLFFKELNEAEQNKYDEIHSVVLLADGTKSTTKFPIADLKAVLKKMTLLEKVVSLLKKNDYTSLSSMIKNTDLIPYDKEQFIKESKVSNAKFGAIQSFQPFGFSRKKTNDGQRILHLSGYLIREIKNNEFSVGLAMDGDKEEVYLVQYEL